MREPCISENDGGWFKSSYSGAGNTECVEAAFRPGSAAVRDSKNLGGPTLSFPEEAWTKFVTAVRDSKDPDRAVLGFSGRAWTDFVTAVRRDELG
ncbi:DUF397 domain-containing protein [Streptomyces botrytidirepellens]|uniref:DUF397 domain-containing protein n=1 Tax=Streptomyces botrytidirepellens TaxID=2486417 RepID=A0A3M8VYZ7_9ACTN|nr:DUF397 domain-containing protein [Streptomyces botrytidirepellens]RNG23112.1 DUF397 domain-containing protein [Streptomyces botrytidirepellens]